MVEVCIFQLRNFFSQLEQMRAMQEDDVELTSEDINAIGLAMENIKKSAEVMSFHEVVKLTEAVSSVALYLHQHSEQQPDYAAVKDFFRQAVQFFRQVLNKLEWNALPDESSEVLCTLAHVLLHDLRGEPEDEAAEVPMHRFYIESLKPELAEPDNVFAVTILFLHADGVEDIQAYSFLQYLQDKVRELHHLPEKILEDENAVETIRNFGLRIWLTTDNTELELRDFLEHTRSVERFEMCRLRDVSECEYWPDAEMAAMTAAETGELWLEHEEPNGYVNKLLTPALSNAPLPPAIAMQFLRLRETVNDLVLADAMAAQNNFPQAFLQVRKLIAQLDRRVRTLLPLAFANENEVPDSLWIEGTSLGVGSLRFTFPNAFIQQPFRPEREEIFADPDGQTLVMHDGECYPLLSLAKLYQVENAVTDPCDGIVMVLEGGSQPFCVLADRVLDVQELEVKPVPDFVSQMIRPDGIIGCTFLQDGSISMVLDVAELSDLLFV